MKLQRIVVGSDFSVASRPAIEQATALAMHHGSELVLVHGTGLADAREPSPADAGCTARWRGVGRRMLCRASRKLHAVADRCRRAGIDVTVCVAHGEPDDVLLSAVREARTDLLVVGTHGRHGIERWLDQSVSERALRQVPCSVLVARASTPARGMFERILCPIDFSVTSEHGLTTSMALSSPEASIHVLHCWEPPVYYGHTPDSHSLFRMRELVRDQGTRACSHHASGARRVQFQVIDAPPIPGIVEKLNSGDREILVIGSHGRHGLRRLIFGSVAEEVTRQAALSVLVVHGGGEPS